MKSIEEINKLDLEELEQAAGSISVPEGLSERIKTALAAEVLVSSAQPPVVIPGLAKKGFGRKSAGRLSGYTRIVSACAFAVAAAFAAVLAIPRLTSPKDTFDDPLLAYAQVEQTFKFISEKMSGGVEMVREAGPVIGKPETIINKINEK